MDINLTDEEAEILRQAALIIIEKLDGIKMASNAILSPQDRARDWLKMYGPITNISGTPDKILTIKEMRNQFNIGLKEAKDICDMSSVNWQW
jgi:ribosomal protein L7/L12